MPAGNAQVVHVAVAVITNARGQVCVSRRPAHTHMGGLWEFPGGKLEPGEDVGQALRREIAEELGLQVHDSRPFIRIEHSYPEKTVCLHVHRVLRFSGEACGREGQRVKWLALNELCDYDFPAANQAIIKAMNLPDKYLITGKFDDSDDFRRKLQKALDGGIELVQLRLKEGHVAHDQVQDLLQSCAGLCQDKGARLLLNIADGYRPFLDLSGVVFAGFHADSARLKVLDERPQGELFCASCHNAEELQKAVALGADFMVLSPVQPTASHPDMPALGWEAFADMIRTVPAPVYALGGVGGDDLDTAFAYGAQGVAAISAFWER